MKWGEGRGGSKIANRKGGYFGYVTKNIITFTIHEITDLSYRMKNKK